MIWIVFGSSITISGSTIVFGAFLDDGTDSDSSSVHIYNTSGVFVTKLVAPDGASSDCFGHSVAISESAIVVGVFWNDDNASYSGSVYIFPVKNKIFET